MEKMRKSRKRKLMDRYDHAAAEVKSKNENMTNWCLRLPSA
jgi:hypothetical protein